MSAQIGQIPDGEIERASSTNVRLWFEKADEMDSLADQSSAHEAAAWKAIAAVWRDAIEDLSRSPFSAWPPPGP